MVWPSWVPWVWSSGSMPVTSTLCERLPTCSWKSQSRHLVHFHREVRLRGGLEPLFLYFHVIGADWYAGNTEHALSVRGGGPRRAAIRVDGRNLSSYHCRSRRVSDLTGECCSHLLAPSGNRKTANYGDKQN